MKKLYVTTVEVNDGRNGHAKSLDGKLNVDLSLVEELGGKGGPATNPEQLFAAGYAACYEQAIKLVGEQRGIEIKDSSITARVILGKFEDRKGFGLEVDLLVDLPGIEPKKAQELVDEAHQICPYSNAIRGNVDVDTRIKQ